VTARRASAARAAVAAALVVVLGTVIAPAAAGRVAAVPEKPRVQSGELELVAQTPTVPRGGTFGLRVRLDGVPADGSVQLVLHDRVRSRSELAASMEGEALRPRVLHNVTSFISTLPVAPDGSHRLTISFDPEAPTGIRLSASGAYPLEVIARDAQGTPVADLVTHVIAEPAATDESPPLSVAVVASLGAPPALQPDGSMVLEADDIEDDLALAGVLAESPDVPVTLSAVPETIDAIATGQFDDVAQLEALRAAAVDRSVLARPYVDTSLEALASARLDEQIDGLLARGRIVLTDSLGVEPDDATWLAGPDLGEDGLAALESLGVQHVILEDQQVEPLTSGTLALSAAKPFLLAPPGERTDPSEVEAFAIDPVLQERVDAREPDAVLAHHLLAELAVLWLEQPGIARGAVVPVDASMPPGALRVLLAGLEGSRMLHATTVNDLFDAVDPLLDAARSPIDRALLPETGASLSRREAAAVATGWDRLETFRGVVGLDSPRTSGVLDHLLLATAAGLGSADRRAHLEAATANIEAVTTAVTLTDRTTITLTARDGTVPLTVRNDAGIPVEVVIRLRSPKLEFPDGESISLQLTERTTRLDLAVRARASGAFPLDVEILSPDGRVVLASTRYTVQSTAVAGAGLVLSVGALLFLIVWWGRHWHKTRRSAKLVRAPHHAPRSHAASAK
jgi:hypothetical protein